MRFQPRFSILGHREKRGEIRGTTVEEPSATQKKRQVAKKSNAGPWRAGEAEKFQDHMRTECLQSSKHAFASVRSLQSVEIRVLLGGSRATMTSKDVRRQTASRSLMLHCTPFQLRSRALTTLATLSPPPPSHRTPCMNLQTPSSATFGIDTAVSLQIVETVTRWPRVRDREGKNKAWASINGQVLVSLSY